MVKSSKNSILFLSPKLLSWSNTSVSLRIVSLFDRASSRLMDSPSKPVAILSFRNQSIASATVGLWTRFWSTASSLSLARSIATDRVRV
jgi:hypothetical protein